MDKRIVHAYRRYILRGIGKWVRIAFCRARGSLPFSKLINFAERFLAASLWDTPKGAAPPWNPASSGKAGTGLKAARDGLAAHGCALSERVDVGMSVGLPTHPQINLAKYRIQRFLSLSEHMNA